MAHSGFGWNAKGEDFTVPDQIGEIFAWRCWTYHQHYGYLRSVNTDYYWKPRQVQVGLCLDGMAMARICDDSVPVPNANCHCGFYAVKELDYQFFYNNNYHVKAYFWGIVALSGKIIEGTRGYRAQFARLVHLWVFHETIEYGKFSIPLIRSVYQVPIDVMLPFSSDNYYKLIPEGEEIMTSYRGEVNDGDRRDDQGVHDRADP